MTHSHIVRVTRLSHPKESDFAFGFRLGYPKDFEFPEIFRIKQFTPMQT